MAALDETMECYEGFAEASRGSRTLATAMEGLQSHLLDFPGFQSLASAEHDVNDALDRSIPEASARLAQC